MLVEDLAAAVLPQLVNARTGRVVASSVECAFTSATRRKGLLGRDGLPASAAIVISRSNAVHTFGMRFAIDIVFVDRHGQVKKVVHGVPPRRIAACLTASTTIEMAAGAIAPGALAPGDVLTVRSGESTGSAESAGPGAVAIAV
jgi:uncharacterized membrane protein (UPF0127 family)